MRKSSLYLAGLTVLFVFANKTALAADFSSKYNVTYTLNPSGTTQVRQDIQVTNQVPEYYLSKYTIDVGNQKVSSISATEKNRELKSALLSNATSSAIAIEFPDKTVGKGLSRSFSISYLSDNTMQKTGNIYQITIPKISGAGISEHNVSLIIPNELGDPTAIAPEPAKIEKGDQSSKLTYTTDQITKSAITVTIGDEQYYTLGLTYHLKNPQNRSVYTEIALPMSTTYQKIIYDEINPKPQSITVDNDGNYIGRYTLLPRQELDVQFIGKAIIYKKQQYQDNPLTAAQQAIYTQKQKYWETSDIAISTLAAKLRTPDKIYQYVVNTLSYDTSKLGTDEFNRRGAVKSLEQPDQSVCMEFTDLFIAIARAAGIPAREVNGFAYTNDPVSRPLSLSRDMLHAWPEYWDAERGWVQVDPTWENTTKGTDYFDSFDLNHIAFVRKGYSSEYPYPAGSYKGKNPDTRDVLVSLTDQFPRLLEDYRLKSAKPKTHIAGGKVELQVVIANLGNVAIHYPATKVIKRNNEESKSVDTVTVPPHTEMPIVLASYTTNATDQQILQASLTVDDKSATTEATIIPWYKSIWVYMAIIYSLGIPVLCVVLYKALHKRTLIKKNMV
jgi:hypothetical protein